MKTCPKCGKDKELTEENFYPARPRPGHRKPGWQSYCKDCWKTINHSNKQRYFAQLRAARIGDA